MDDHCREYIAARVIFESKPVTYRLLSRAMEVNVNAAKQMLYEFHAKENAKTPKSVHATYLLTGRKRSPVQTNGANGRDGDDIIMQSSPYMSSMPEREAERPADASLPKTSVVLVREEELESTKAEFEEITSIHIYSLEPGPIENLNLLTVCNHEAATEFSKKDPLERWRLYGSIHNPYVKRRTGKAAPVTGPSSTKPAPKVAPKLGGAGPSVEKATTAPARKGSASEESVSGRSTPQPASAASGPKKQQSKSNLRRDASDIFKSFAKGKQKSKEAEKSKESTPAPVEDAPMQGMSEDEGDDDDAPDVKFDDEKIAQARKARLEREQALQKMMEDASDDEMADVTPAEGKDSQEVTQDNTPTGTPAEVDTAVVQGGRRRGRRKVLKRKKVKDEDGYLVTKEEYVWESFSEDEPEPKKSKPAPKPMNTAKGQKTGKRGQGSIANFFKKA